MKKKSTSQCAFFNLRVLIGLFVCLAGVFPMLFGTSATEVNPSGEGNPSVQAPSGECPPTITQSASHSVVPFNSIVCADPFNHFDSSYWRAFNMQTFTGGQAYDVTSISFGIQETFSGSGTGQPVTVRLYTNSGEPFPGGNWRDNLAAEETFNVTDQFFNLLTVPFVTTVPAGTFELVMEVFTPDGHAAGNRFIIGSNPEEQTAPSYVSWPACGLPDPTDLATIFPTMHIVFDVNGSCPGQITLSAAKRKVGGINTVRLTWAGAISNNVDVYRNSVVVATTANDGRYVDSTGDTGRAQYMYMVCEAGTATCSNQVTVRFRR